DPERPEGHGGGVELLVLVETRLEGVQHDGERKEGRDSPAQICQHHCNHALASSTSAIQLRNFASSHPSPFPCASLASRPLWSSRTRSTRCSTSGRLCDARRSVRSGSAAS